MTVSEITRLLNARIGLEVESIGRDSISRAVQRRVDALALDSKEAYLPVLQASDEEVSALVEEIVVPETWFFRNREAFGLLERYVTTEWRTSHPGAVLRALSVPCSTGEEPYAISMALMNAGLSPDEFTVDAVDVSSRAIAKALYAVYGKNSFREGSLSLCGRYFQKTETGYSLDESVRRTVTFHNGNILDGRFMRALGTFDVIFCRNLLIYLDTESQESTVRLLSGMLKSDGMLFVGHAESGRLWKDLFTSERYPMAFAYRKFNDDRRAREPVALGKKAAPEPGVRAPKRERRRKPTYPPRRASEEKAPETMPTDEKYALKAAHELADTGRMKEAKAECEAYLREHGASAQAYFILGLISDTGEDKGAANDFFKKALYLEPDHYEALVHLSLLMEEQGDAAGAERLRRRTERVYERLAAAGGKKRA